MNRIASPRVLGSLRHASTPKCARLTSDPRNFSTGLRPLILNSPSRISCGRIASPSLVRANSSLASVSEEDIFTLDQSPVTSFEDIANANKVKLRSSQTGLSGPFGKLWLRENCQCSECIHPDTRQRTVDTFSIPEDISVQKVEYRRYRAKVTWSDGHRSVYPYTFLVNNHPKKINRKLQGAPLRFREYMSHDPLRSSGYPTVSYLDVMANDKGLLEWLQNIYDWGFCFVNDVPINPESTEGLLKRIAFIRNTHYGGFWDFTADLTFKDTAYTNEYLGAHTDNTYFTDPARLQLFHLLSHNGEGGASLLVDGFRAAETLLQENPRHAAILMGTKHPYHASGNDDICIQPAEHYPVFKNHSYLRQLYQVRWNNYDRAPKRDWWFEEQDRWYKAARHFNEIIRRPDMEIWTKLKPGTALIFDNWRMLHGRSQFTGKRRMCGGYINNDDFISRFRLTKFGREKVLENLGNTTRHSSNPGSYI